MDFLFEALQEWEAAKARNEPNLPPWSVRIRCMAGTSAGGLTAVIGAGSLTAPHNPVGKSYTPGGHPPPEDNRFFSGWISGFNYQRMFSCDDLDIEKALKAGEEPEVRSLLNCDFVSNHAKNTIAAVSTSAPIPNWAKDIELYITTTDLRGIPYSLDGFYGASGDSMFKVLQHGDSIYSLVEATRRVLQSRSQRSTRRSCLGEAPVSGSSHVGIPLRISSRHYFHAPPPLRMQRKCPRLA